MLKEKISKLKKQKNAIILAHNYQLPEIQDIADVIGDSLELSRIAANSGADVIVFCGVRFMAETAKILSPKSKVLIPEKDAGCFLADTITESDLETLRNQHPNAVFVAYVNSYAAVKANVDVCCTSANAVNVVSSIPEDREVVFIPDRNLARYVIKETGRNNIFTWGSGYCDVHENIKTEDIIGMKKLYPNAKVIAHPECREDVLDIADYVGSTSGMIRIARQEDVDEFIIATEKEMVYRLSNEMPSKKFYPVSQDAVCSTMKLTTLDSVIRALGEEIYEVVLSEEIISKSQDALNKMISIGAAK